MNNFTMDELGLMRLGSSHTHFLKEVAEIQYNFSVHEPVPLDNGEDTDFSCDNLYRCFLCFMTGNLH